MPADGSQTTCAQCGMTVSSRLRFCPHCGRPLVRKPICPSCGAELVPGNQFCRECGKKADLPAEPPGTPLVTVPGPAGSAGIPVAPLPQAGSPVPVPVKASGGSSLVKIMLFAGAALVLIFVLLVVIGLFLPDSPAEESGIAATVRTAPSDIRPSSQEVKAREKARTDTVAALRQGDASAVLGLLTEGDRVKYGSGLGLNAAGMATLATAISSAEVTEETPLTALYETSIGGSRYSFMAVKEDGAWKLSGI